MLLFFIDNRPRTTISTVINAIHNMSSLNVECGMSAGCNCVIDWTITATFFGIKRNNSTTVKTM